MAAATTSPPPSTSNLSEKESSSMKAALEVQSYLSSRLSAPSTTTTPSTTPFTIPIIDLSSTYPSSPNYTPTSRAEIAREIHHACTTTGFFYITSHSIPAPTTSSILTQAHSFFHALPPSSKEALHVKHSAYFRGYEDAAYTTVNPLDLDGEGGKETKEAFNWGYEEGLDPEGGDGGYVELDGKRVGRGAEVGSVNQWPDERELPGFKEGVRGYYGEALQLARHLFRLFALSLDLPEDYFDSLMTHPGGIARLIRYPPATNPKPLSELNEDEEIGLGAHTDYECFTLLLQDSNPGLEILSPDNRWISALPVEGGIVVNVGDFLMRWTNGIYKSTVHRVVNRTDKERYSIPLFFSINYDETVETLPSCVSEDNPSRYPPIAAGQYVLDRLNMTVKTGKY